MKARYAFVVIALLMFLLAAANVLYTAHEVSTQQGKWCGLVVTLDKADEAAPKRPAAGTFTAALVAEIHQLRSELGCEQQ